MLRSLWKGPERRRFPRIDAEVDIEIAVEVYGFEGEVHPFFASGQTLNVARGGILARLDAPVPTGSVCKVFFRNAGDSIRPNHVLGRVVRCDEADDGFLIAAEFEEPLLRLEVALLAVSAARK